MGKTRYFNGKVYCGGGLFSDEFFVEDGRFAAPGPCEAEQDLHKRLVLPGFIDSHTHIVSAGLNTLGADCSTAKDMEELLHVISGYIAHAGITQPFGRGFDETMIKERRFPTPEEFESATGGVPFYMVRVDLHSMMVNSSFEARYGFQGSGGIIRGEEYDRAVIALGDIASAEDRLKGLAEMQRRAFSAGVTTVHTMEGWHTDMTNVDFILEHGGDFDLDMVLYPQVYDVSGVAGRGLKRIGGCILVDGSLGSRTAALGESYADMPGNFGRLYHGEEELADFAGRAHELGLQMSFHAIGDAAVRQITDVYERVFSKHGRGKQRHRIEHCVLASDKELDRIAAMGLWLDFQPAFHARWAGAGGLYEQRLGAERVLRVNPMASAVRRGIPVAFGSDCDVTPLDPLGGIRAAVTADRRGESVDIFTAVDAFTVNAAAIAGDECEHGSFRPGNKADFVILDGDLFDPWMIDDVGIINTYKGGRPWLR